MAYIYRDKTTSDRILVPVNEAGEAHGTWSVKCAEIMLGHKGDLIVRGTFIPADVLHFHYRKEEL